MRQQHAPVAKLVDALDLGSSNASCVGSSPIRRTTREIAKLVISLLFSYFSIIHSRKVTEAAQLYSPIG